MAFEASFWLRVVLLVAMEEDLAGVRLPFGEILVAAASVAAETPLGITACTRSNKIIRTQMKNRKSSVKSYKEHTKIPYEIHQCQGCNL